MKEDTKQIAVFRFTATREIDALGGLRVETDDFARLQQLYEKWPLQTLTALHEAAHVVAAKTFGQPVVGVCIDEPDGGRTITNQYPMVERKGDEIAVTQEKLVILAAGGEAVRLLAPDDDPGDSDDLSDMRFKARALVGLLAGESFIEWEIERAQARAELLVRRNWRAIVSVAFRLLELHETAAAIGGEPARLEDFDPITQQLQEQT